MSPLTRRALLRSSAAAVLPTAAGMEATAKSSKSRDHNGVVWSNRKPLSGDQILRDVTNGSGTRYLVCGMGEESAIIRTTDEWGRTESQRRGPEWGDSAHTLCSLADGYLLAGVDGDEPLLVDFEDLSTVRWRRVFDGIPDGTVHAASLGDQHVIGWTDAGTDDGGRVHATMADGTQIWSVSLPTNRSLTSLATTSSEDPLVHATGPIAGSDQEADGWARTWRPDGSETEDRTLDLPGTPSTLLPEEASLLLAGVTTDEWWLQRRDVDWSVQWTETHTVAGENPTLVDLVAGENGFAIVGNDADGAVMLRLDKNGSERWRGHYPQNDDDTEPSLTARAGFTVTNDEVVVAGGTSSDGDQDTWLARLGDPAVATPADVPSPTDTPGPTTFPQTTAADVTEPTAATPTEEPGPGFGVAATLGGFVGWLATRLKETGE